MMMTMMNTRPTNTFALGSSTAATIPAKQPISSLTISSSSPPIKTTSRSCSAISPQAADIFPNREQKKEAVKEITSITSSRRDAIRIGLYLAAATLFSRNSQAAELAASTVEYTVTPSGLGYYDKVVGTGPQPTKGQLIKAHYVGKLENGQVFDSSYNRGKPLSFRVGVGEVIRGWDQGILGGDGIPPMLPGGKRSLKLPSDLAYGMRGAGCKGGTNCIIPPNSTLLFDVEFIGKA